MRRHGAAVCLVGSLLALAPAAGRAQGAPEWGLKGGLNVAMLRGGGSSFDSKLGALGGGFVVYDFSTEFGLESGLLFTMKGAKVLKGSPTGTVESFLILDYLEVPVLLRWNIPTGTTTRSHLYAGPTLAFRVSSRNRTETETTDLKDVQGLDSGVAIGGSVDFPLNPGRLVVDLRYGIGLTDAFGDQARNYKNDVLSIMAGVSF